MINNSFAWQSLQQPTDALRFFWAKNGNEPTAVVKPVEPSQWYWPNDGAVIDGKLYLFCKLVKRDAGKPAGFEFDWMGNDLLQIQNPRDEPTAWRFERRSLPNGTNDLRLSSACLVDGNYLYAYGLFPDAPGKGFDRPLGVARISLKKLKSLDMGGWEFWCGGEKDGRWLDKPTDPVALFHDAAPEMTISRVRGINGFVATYTSLGLSADIMVRHSLRPEGPWSRSLRVYHCPEEKLMLYAAKAHPELAEKDGQLIITYCRNAGSLAEHFARPDIYFPQGVAAQVRVIDARTRRQ